MTRLAEYYVFLDALRESGVTNMYGAAPYLEEEFDIDHKESKKALLSWMKTFDPNKSPQERANNSK